MAKWWWLPWVAAVIKRVPQSPDCWRSCNVRRKMRDGGEDDDKGMVSDTEGVRSLGGRETSSPMRGGICVCVAAVVVMVVAALMVVMGRGGEVVLMVVVGKVVLVMVVRVLCFEVFRVVGVLCIGRGGLCRSGAIFVLEVVEGMELVVGCVVGRVVRLVLLCMNGRGYFCVALAWNWWKWPDWVWVGFSLGWLSGRIVSPFGTWFLGQDGRRGRVDGHGGWVCCSGGCGCGASRIFCLFPEWLFGEYDGCESGDRGCGWCGGVRVVEIVCGVRIGVGVGGVGCEEGVVSGRGNVSVADGGGDRWRDCCRFPAGIFGELWEDLPYCFPFTLDIGDVFLYVGL